MTNTNKGYIIDNINNKSYEISEEDIGKYLMKYDNSATISEKEYKISVTDADTFFKLVDRVIHLISLHQTSLDNHIRINKDSIKQVSSINESGLSNENYDEMKYILLQIKEILKKENE